MPMPTSPRFNARASVTPAQATSVYSHVLEDLKKMINLADWKTELGVTGKIELIFRGTIRPPEKDMGPEVTRVHFFSEYQKLVIALQSRWDVKTVMVPEFLITTNAETGEPECIVQGKLRSTAPTPAR